MQVLNFLIRSTAELEVNLVAVERISEYSELNPEADWRKPNEKKGWMHRGEVNFEKYALRYRDGLPLVLKQLDCQISGGEKNRSCRSHWSWEIKFNSWNVPTRRACFWKN